MSLLESVHSIPGGTLSVKMLMPGTGSLCLLGAALSTWCEFLHLPLRVGRVCYPFYRWENRSPEMSSHVVQAVLVSEQEGLKTGLSV